jgi:hypothetical protein
VNEIFFEKENENEIFFENENGNENDNDVAYYCLL